MISERMKQIFAAMKKSSEYKDDEDKREDILEQERYCIIDGRGRCMTMITICRPMRCCR